MNYYIASGLENGQRVRLVAEALCAHTRTYDWTSHGDIRAQGPERMRTVAGSELAAVLEADLVLVLLPGGKGTHTELGAALASYRPGRRLIVWSETGVEFDAGSGSTHPSVCAFYFHQQVERWICSFEMLLAQLRAL